MFLGQEEVGRSDSRQPKRTLRLKFCGGGRGECGEVAVKDDENSGAWALEVGVLLCRWG